MKAIAIIPARGGSKGVPGKNIKLFNGKPLIVHSIEQALLAPQIETVYVSTDDDAIAAISLEAGAKVIHRPHELSGDTATSESALTHAIDSIEKEHTFDTVLFLQATSPLRPKGGIEEALTRFERGECDSLVSISATHRFFWNIKGDRAVAQYDYLNRPRRQDMTLEDTKYVENGSLYVFSVSHYRSVGNRLGGAIGYVIFDEEYSLEIDSYTDFAILEKIAEDLEVQ